MFATSTGPEHISHPQDRHAVILW